MKHAPIKKGIIPFAIIAIFITITWVISEKSSSYSEPQEAIVAVENDLMLIPAYKINGEALFFFIKDKNNLGATYVREGLFGWKAEFLSWSPMNVERTYEYFNGQQRHGENLIFGLIKQGDDRLIQLGDQSAKILNLEMLPTAVVEEYQLNGLYIWYFEINPTSEEEEIRLIHKSTEEVIDKMDV